MPLYEYKCHACGVVFEVRQKVSDEALAVHDGCGGQLERLLSPSALQFKGTGWYITDYARSSQRKLEPQAGKNGSSKETSKSDSSKTESSSTKSSSSEK
jgi:putative FmdB family regulatory protein